MTPPARPFQTIGDVFYRVRALRGREWTLRRFAEELGIDPVFLGYIEKGQRFPNEALVRKLAALAQRDPRELLAILYRDRMVHALGREIRRAVLGASEEGGGGDGTDPADADLPATFSSVLARALAALPDDGSPLALERWRRAVRAALRDETGRAARADLERVERVLTAKRLVAITDDGVRKKGRHLQAVSPDERIDLAVEFAATFAKSLTDKLVRGQRSTYLKSHFLTLPAGRVDAFRAQLDAAIAAVVEEHAVDEEGAEFVRVLVAGTPRE